ncbi:MAG: alpha-xylosidase, partial [Chloroflexota bacterium]
YLFGDSFLVCPVISPTGVRNVYLPQGEWIDFWSGSHLSGPLLLRDVWSPLARLPLYVRKGREITFAEPVEHTGQYHQAKRAAIRFDVGYAGFEASPLSQWLNLD